MPLCRNVRGTKIEPRTKLHCGQCGMPIEHRPKQLWISGNLPPQHPISAMWKAGLLAELDDLGGARAMLRRALTEIQRSVRQHVKNIDLLSLEGWCSYVLFAVEAAFDFNRYEAIRDEFWERWHELKAWDCSPWAHKDYFDEVLKGPAPE